MNIAELDNPADTLITLRISGNRLVSVCNALQAMMVETKRMTPNDDSWEFSSDSYKELHDVIERVRDELSAQRMAKNHAA